MARLVGWVGTVLVQYQDAGCYLGTVGTYPTNVSGTAWTSALSIL